MISESKAGFTVSKRDNHWLISFSAMASPCEILVKLNKVSEVNHLASLALTETRRIEQKFSRYCDDNIIHRLNHSNGTAVEVDEETGRLLTYAAHCFELSDGRFDVTSGVLRKAWKFNGEAVTPNQKLIESLLTKIGWQKVDWGGRAIILQPGMEIDLGGIGKEYAVDRVAQLLFEELGVSMLVNFGGDIRGRARKDDDQPWVIGLEDPSKENRALGEVRLSEGSIATSGDAKRFCLVDGNRLGHILDPTTGWPVAGAPRSVTVVADTCTSAGLLSTLAMLRGAEAESFLEAQEITHYCVR